MSKVAITGQGFTLRVHRSSRRAGFGVAVDGRGLTSRSGTAALRELADLIGLTDALSAAAAPVSSDGLIHEPGAVLRDLVVMLADGGDDFSAIGTLRGQTGLGGAVASDSTAWRRVADLAGHELSVVRLDAARRRVRATVWRHGGAPPAVVDPSSGLVCVDVDATLVTAHSDKESAAGTYKRGFGFHPLLAYLDRDDGTGEALAAQLRAGNAGSNTAVDHIDIFETALDQLPDVEAERVVVRADSAGSTQAFLGYLGEAGVEFSVGARLDEQVRPAIRIAQSRPDGWVPAVGQDGQVRDGAHVTEITGHVDVSAYPAGTRVLVRREPLHPGAQQTFDDLDGHRFTALLTSQTDTDLAALDRRHRAHARVEQRIRDAKTLGLRNLPSADFAMNQIWLQLVLLAQDLLAWFAVLTLDGDLAVAAPATVRYRLLHVAGRITRSSRRVTLHLDATWPWAADLAEAFRRLRTLSLPA